METEIIKRGIEFRGMIDVLLSDRVFADLVLKNGKIVNVLTREIYDGDIAISKGKILLVGDCEKLIGESTMVVEMDGKYLSPGFIDSHMHFESSMLTVTEFSRLSIPSGTTTLVADPHEIGNVLGELGMKAMADEVDNVPNKVHLVVPSFVPDCPYLETAGVEISSKDMESLLSYKHIDGVGELQGFSNARNVYEHTPDVIDDLIASSLYAAERGMTVDGNAPELFGAELAAHILATGGKCSCHETTTKAECVEKLRQGVYVFIREGSTQWNMEECIKAVTEEHLDSRRCILVSDDMVASDLIKLGHMNEIVKRAIERGVDPVEAIQMVTINPATYFNLKDVGVLAPGKSADIVVIRDIKKMEVEAVFIDGMLQALNGEIVTDLPKYEYPDSVKKSVRINRITEDDLHIKAGGNRVKARCIELIEYQNLSGQAIVEVPVRNGIAEADVKNDILMMFCVERHGRTGTIGRSFLRGMRLKSGAIAESIGHDTHNIMAVGTNYRDIMLAINRVIDMDGGIAVADRGSVIKELRLAVGGLITDELDAHELVDVLVDLESAVERALGSDLAAPFMHLSFLSLSTSPEWKLTNKGIVDVNSYKILDVLV